MATAKFVKTSLLDRTDQSKSQAIVTVDDQEVTVDFWYSIIDQYGKDGTKAWLCAEALKQTGNLADAHTLLKINATGTVTLDKDGKVVTDTRNWQQRYIHNYPIVPVPSEPVVDPLAADPLAADPVVTTKK